MTPTTDKLIERLRRDMQAINDDCDGENHLNVSSDALDAIDAYKNNRLAARAAAEGGEATPGEPTASGAVNWPTEAELLAFGAESQHFLACDSDAYADMALEILARFRKQIATAVAAGAGEKGL